MNHILSKEHSDLLAQIAWSRVLLAFDFDGTLAPIVADRDAATMRDRTRRLFTRVASLCPCAVISGRSQGDIAARLRGIPVKHIIGNHGLEPGARLSFFERDITRTLPVVRDALSDQSGVDVEDKRYSIAIHYRRSRAKRQVRAAIARVLFELPIPMRAIPGKLVMNLVPLAAPNKGEALLRLRAIEGADTALYVGDDVTDEDVFCLDQPGRLLTVRVGFSKASSAAFCLQNQTEIDRLLSILLQHRERRAAL